MKDRQLVVIAGPTAVGKTALSVKLAKALDTVVLSADSRQFYKEMSIGTAKPGPEEMQGVPHYFINCCSVKDKEPYNASTFEQDALKLLKTLFRKHRHVILSGGSGLYINALCHGFDEGIPPANDEIRETLNRIFEEKGIEVLQERLKELDPEYYELVDRQNHKRLIRALEVCLQTGQPYSSIRKGKRKERPFSILKIGLEMDRESLFRRIDLRVEQMIRNGLEEEARSLLPYLDKNALKTVGYQELFACFKGEMSREEAIEKIRINTHRYAKRQLTWFKKDKAYHWFHPEQYEDIIALIQGGEQQNSYF